MILEVLWNTPWGFKCPFSLLYLPEIFFALLIFQKPFCHQLHRFKWHLFGTKSTEHPSNIKKNIFNSFNIRMRINLIFFSFYLTLCSTWWLRESKSKKRHFICTPNFKESTASLQFDTKNFLKKIPWSITFSLFVLAPVTWNLKLCKEKDEWRWLHAPQCNLQTARVHVTLHVTVFFSFVVDFSRCSVLWKWIILSYPPCCFVVGLFGVWCAFLDLL